jgi:hypothetical protein
MLTDEHIDRRDEATGAARDYANVHRNGYHQNHLPFKFRNASASKRKIKNKWATAASSVPDINQFVVYFTMSST